MFIVQMQPLYSRIRASILQEILSRHFQTFYEYTHGLLKIVTWCSKCGPNKVNVSSERHGLMCARKSINTLYIFFLNKLIG